MMKTLECFRNSFVGRPDLSFYLSKAFTNVKCLILFSQGSHVLSGHVVQEHAEFYAQMMARGGLRSTIEPDQSTL